ncbi:hypothetical protein ACFS2C_17445 [Prauserella oleivorans]|uniref:Uncharacterized protein n=1 Tax=Prauserella oleivorans TaxID=1478153 RepID=A0ABW5WCD7_9PSEU
MSRLPVFARGLCDDAAVFPPGLAPLADAVPAHREHRAGSYGELVGPLVLAAPALAELGTLIGDGDRLDLAVTAPAGPDQVTAAVEQARALPVDIVAFEVAVPAEMTVPDFVGALGRACAAAPGATVYVEVPRDERRPEVIAAIAASGHKAKFRTGGVKAELYPDERELAAAIAAVVEANVPFKATAGLHHALRNTDPKTGFEQHGFLNLLLATDAALGGAGEADLVGVLSERDGDTVAAAVRGLGDERAAAARRAFVSFGTCSITEPLDELVELALVPESVRSGEGVTA